jgi:hypothetical protein
MVRMRLRCLLPAFLILVPCVAAEWEPVDEFGGWTAHDLGATGRFRLARWNKGWWLVTPSGHPLSVVGLCHAQMPRPDMRAPDDLIEAKFQNDPLLYARDLLAWMRGAGFNTFSYGDPEGLKDDMNRLGELMLVPGFIPGVQFPDLFDPAWRKEAAAKISRLVPAMSRDRRIIGYVLSHPLLFSPVMERPAIWRGGAIKRQNYMMAVKALPRDAPGKRAYVDYLRRKYVSYASYARRRGNLPAVRSFDRLLDIDLSANDSYETLHPDDAGFYTEMWHDLTAFLVAEIRKYDPQGLIFSYRFIRVMRWPDPWLEAMLKGVGSSVDAFAAELYGDNQYREIVDGIGRIAGKPTLILDGMRPEEFTYAEEANDEGEARAYDTMYRSLLQSAWFLGGSVCEYRDRWPASPYYSPRPNVSRLGVRRPDFAEREPLLACYRNLHSRKYVLRQKLLNPQ